MIDVKAEMASLFAPMAIEHADKRRYLSKHNLVELAKRLLCRTETKFVRPGLYCVRSANCASDILIPGRMRC